METKLNYVFRLITIVTLLIPCTRSYSMLQGQMSDTAKFYKSVGLTSFKLSYLNNEVRIEFETYAEINNEGFSVERSTDLNIWNNITSLPGAGTTSLSRKYQATDPFPIEGYSYYRIAQIDFDGTITYGPIQCIYIVNDELKVYPNPSSGQINFELENENESECSIQVYALDGKLCKDIFSHSTHGNFSIEELPIGYYILKVKNQSNEKSRLFVKSDYTE